MNTIIGIFILFIGLHELTTHLQAMPWEADNEGLRKWTKHPVACLSMAAVIAFLLQSSTTAVLFVIGLVAGRRLTVQSAYYMLLGINFGTALQWPMLRFPVFITMMLLGIISFLYRLMRERGKYQKWAAVMVGVSLIFIGLHMIQGSLTDITHQLWMQESIRQMVKPWQGFVQGFFWTSVLTSSGLSLLAIEGIAPVATRQALFYVMGANVGTATTGIICTLASTIDAKRIAFLHALLNLMTSGIVGILLFLIPQQWMAGLSSAWPNPFHVLFNAILIGMGLMFHEQMLKAVTWLIPEQRQQSVHHSLGDADYSESVVRFQKSLWSYFRLLYLWIAKEGEKTSGRLIALEKSIDESFLRLQKVQHSYLIICHDTMQCDQALSQGVLMAQFWNSLKTFAQIAIEVDFHQQDHPMLQHLLQNEMKKLLDRYYGTIQGTVQPTAAKTSNENDELYQRALLQEIQQGQLSMAQGQMYAKTWQILKNMQDTIVAFETKE